MNDVDRISRFAGVERGLAQLVVSAANRGGHSLQALRGESRAPDLVEARQSVIRQAFTVGFGVTEIGRALNRDHSTVWHHVQLMGVKRQRPISDQVQLSFLAGPLFDAPIQSPAGRMFA